MIKLGGTTWPSIEFKISKSLFCWSDIIRYSLMSKIHDHLAFNYVLCPIKNEIIDVTWESVKNKKEFLS